MNDIHTLFLWDIHTLSLGYAHPFSRTHTLSLSHTHTPSLLPPQVVKTLLEAGGDPSALNQYDRTPVDEAISGRHEELINIINAHPRIQAATQAMLDALPDEVGSEEEEEGEGEDGMGGGVDTGKGGAGEMEVDGGA